MGYLIYCWYYYPLALGNLKEVEFCVSLNIVNNKHYTFLPD